MTLLAQLAGEQLPERYYLGVDVGYREHVAVVIPLKTFVSGGEAWKKARCLHFSSTHAGLERLQAYLERFSKDPTRFFGICEPTGGYYGASLYQYLLDRSYAMQMVENATTRTMREKIFGGIPKTDEIDGRVMARIAYLHEAVGEEFSLHPLRLLDPDNHHLHTLCRDSWSLSSLLTRTRNQFAQVMAMVFPELKTFFPSSVSSFAPVSLIAAYPTPALLAEAAEAEVRQVLWQTHAYQHAERVKELQQLARESAGVLPDPGRAWRIQWLTTFLLTNFQAEAQLDREIKQALEKHSAYPLLAQVPYAGPATLGIILSTAGDITRFRNYRRYVAYTGYFAGLETSQTIDRTRMSKRGNRDLKRAYFLIAAPLVWWDPNPNPYKQLYERKRAEGRAWYTAMPFVCAALARHFYHCLKYKEPYKTDKIFKCSLPLPTSIPVAEGPRQDLDEQFEIMDALLSLSEG